MFAKDWKRSPLRAELISLYAQADALALGLSCDCAARRSRCCRFGVTGREPYPTAVELTEVASAVRSLGGARSRSLPLAGDPERPCPLLAADGRCRIYESRPFGCRTFFCDDKPPRSEVQRIGRAIADLSARHAPRDPGPRPLTRALAAGHGMR